MSIIWMDSFDHYTTVAQATSKGYLYSPNSISSSYKRTGTQSAYYTAQGERVPTAVSIANNTAIFIHLATYATVASSYWYLAEAKYDASANADCSIEIQADGRIGACRGGYSTSPTVLATTAPGIHRLNQWNHWQIKFIVHDSTGAIICKLNGEEILNVSGVDTRYTSNTATNVIQLIRSGTNIYVDDLVINYNDSDGINDDFLGDVRVVCLLPQTDAVAAGSNADFTCSSSTDHGALVDESTPDDDTSYVYSSTLNHVDSWEYPALGYTGDIKGVQMSLRAKKSDSGTRAIAAVTKPVATNRVHGTNHYLGMTDYLYFNSIWDQNPEDSAAWEVADVDGAEFGVKVTV